MMGTKRAGTSQLWAIDLFCGVGGLTHGLVKAGVRVAAGIDIDPDSRYAYEENNAARFIEKDITKVTKQELANLYPADSVRVLAGCAPCQPFSTLSQGRDARKDSKWGLLGEFGRLARALQPDYVTMENVPQLRKHTVFTDFVKTLRALDYHVVSDVLYCPEYGVPQERSRLVLLASRHGPISMPAKTHGPASYLTVGETIRKLPPLRAGEQDAHDPIHKAAGLTPINMKRIRASKPGGTWRDWDPELVLPCHRKENGKSWPGVYGRMTWDAPSPTITTEFYNLGSGRFGHPVQNRALSLREGALLQTFPRDYKFIDRREKLSLTGVATLIGNAVPVRLGEVIGRALLSHARGERPARSGQQQLAHLDRPRIQRLRG